MTINFEETIAKAQSFETVAEARKWVITIIKDLVDLKLSPGGILTYKNLLRQIVEPFRNKGKVDFFKEIQGYVKEEENRRTQEKFNDATKDKQRDQFETGEDGIVLATQDNIVKVLSNNRYLDFRYDNFTEQNLFRFSGEMIWHEGLAKHYIEISYPKEHDITGLKVNRWYIIDGHLAELKLYLHQFFPDERYWRELPDAIEVVTKRNQINIYQDWMDHGLPEWDGVDRMDFLFRYAGVEHKEWAITIGLLLFLGIVSRCYEPGYDFRGNIILEGVENIGKSWLTKSIAFDERFTTPFTFSKNSEGYESARQLRGQVVVELPDKGGIDSKTPDQIKAFLTYTHDVNRRMNTNVVEHLKRSCVFIVTCNESGAYLKGDVEGDTRFYPVRCNGKIDVEAIKKELPQLYAQAKYLWECGITPRPTENELKLQREFIAPRQLKPNYYYWVLEQLKLHRNQMVHEWDDGFTMDEMLSWIENETWFSARPKTQHRREIAKVLPIYFHIETTVRGIPVQYQTEGGPKTLRKWRYIEKDGVKWNDFINELED
jgi:predicted P-loop ATPase